MSTNKTVKISQNKVLDYRISKDGYKPIIGSKLITDTTTININMVSTESTDNVYNFGDRVGGIATIVGYYSSNDGKKYAFAVLDAKYRTGGIAWAGETVDTGLPNYSSAPTGASGNESATYNTDYILNNYSASVYCGFNAARSQATITIGDVTLNSQLPNAYEILQIYTFRNSLDALDPTLDSYSSNSLATWNMANDSYSYVWCSNENSSNLAWWLSSSGVWISNSRYTKNSLYRGGIVPVLEIPVD